MESWQTGTIIVISISLLGSSFIFGEESKKLPLIYENFYYDGTYSVTDGITINSVRFDSNGEIIFSLVSENQGSITVDIPSELLKLRYKCESSDRIDPPFVLANGEEIKFTMQEQSNQKTKSLQIPISKGTYKIDIIFPTDMGRWAFPTGCPIEFFEDAIPLPPKKQIPQWIKNNALWWSEGKIGDTDFVLGIKYLIEQNIMKIPPTESGSSNSQQIPPWVKNNAKWWANGQISDDDFVKGIQYVISNGIMKISATKNTSLCQGTKLCVTGTIEKIVDGDTIYVNGEKIRLSLTNTPERNEAGYAEATQFTSTLCPVGSPVTVDQDDKQPYDRFGRMVGKVFCGSKMLNEELLITKHAQILTLYCSKSEYASELWAKKFGC